MKRKLICTTQNRLGALDRILGTLTHWGFLTEKLESQVESDTGYLTVSVTLECNETSVLKKLMKAIQKQVYVLDVSSENLSNIYDFDSAEAEKASAALLNQAHAIPVLPLISNRRTSHVNSNTAS